MSKSTLNTHKIENFLIRLNSIMECIETQGDEFVTEEVKRDAIEAVDFIKNEFLKASQEKSYE